MTFFESSWSTGRLVAVREVAVLQAFIGGLIAYTARSLSANHDYGCRYEPRTWLAGSPAHRTSYPSCMCQIGRTPVRAVW